MKWIAFNMERMVKFLLNPVPYGIMVASLVCLVPLRGDADDSVRRDATVLAIEQIMPSVVNIATATMVQRLNPYEELWRRFYGYGSRQPKPEYSRGSGVIIEESGYVITNAHVVRDVDKIWVKLNHLEEPLEARIVALTPKTDLALLKIINPKNQTFTAARLAKDDDLYLGETVLALGNPFGLGGSVSRGILSSKSRRPNPEDTWLDVEDWLQTDAAINPGNSGGPLINLNGEIIGINVAVLRDGQGIGFAIPAKQVSDSLAEIFTPEMEGLWFGAKVVGGTRPLRVAEVQAGSPAELAGLKPDDVILSVGERIPKTFLDLTLSLIRLGSDRSIAMKILRNQAATDVSLRLIPEKDYFNPELVRRKIGASIQELSPELAEVMRLEAYSGLLIAGIDPGSPADRVGLKDRFVIQKVNNQPVRSVIEFAKILNQVPTGSTVTLEVLGFRVLGRFVQSFVAPVEVTLR